MAIASIKEKIQNMEYGWNKPASYIVLVPIISTIVQSIQLSYMKNKVNDATTSALKIYWENRGAQMNKWHHRGAAIQALVTMAFMPFVNPPPNPKFAAILLVMAMQLVKATCHSIFDTFHIIEGKTYDPNGNLKSFSYDRYNL